MPAVYVIPDSGLGALRAVPVRLTADPPEPGTHAVTLHPSGLGFTVEADGPRGTATLADYPELHWIARQGLLPQVTALADATSLTLRLPRPGLCLPANRPPDRPWTLLPAGPAVALTKTPPGHAGHRQLLVELRSTRTAVPPMVTAHVDGSLVGALSIADSQRLSPTIVELAEHDVATVARGYLAPRGEGHTLTFCAGPAARAATLYAPRPQP